jgi:3-hydroxyacyl-CoA dehydrogenase
MNSVFAPFLIDIVYAQECLKQLVQAGNKGRKSGQGFYRWSGDKVIGPADF